MDLTAALTRSRARSVRFHPASLDAVNFLLADVRAVLGPYLNVLLVTQQHRSVWPRSESDIFGRMVKAVASVRPG